MEQIIADELVESVDAVDAGCRVRARSTSSVISGYEYRWFFGIATPFIRFVDPVGEGAFPLIGHHWIYFDVVRRCPACGVVSTQDGDLCENCRELPLHRQLACILDGPDRPFGDYCQRDRPACGNKNWARSVCYSPWIIYIANVFGLTKVGISRKNRAGCMMGFTQRLLSQGACEWIAIGPVNGLKEALRVEDNISTDLGLTKRVTQYDRWHDLDMGHQRIVLPREEIASWLAENHLGIFIEGDFTQEYCWPLEGSDVRRGDSAYGMNGSLVYNIGPIIGMQADEDTIEYYDISQLTGKTIVGDL